MPEYASISGRTIRAEREEDERELLKQREESVRSRLTSGLETLGKAQRDDVPVERVRMMAERGWVEGENPALDRKLQEMFKDDLRRRLRRAELTR